MVEMWSHGASRAWRIKWNNCSGVLFSSFLQCEKYKVRKEKKKKYTKLNIHLHKDPNIPLLGTPQEKWNYMSAEGLIYNIHSSFIHYGPKLGTNCYISGAAEYY